MKNNRKFVKSRHKIPESKKITSFFNKISKESKENISLLDNISTSNLNCLNSDIYKGNEGKTKLNTNKIENSIKDDESRIIKNKHVLTSKQSIEESIIKEKLSEEFLSEITPRKHKLLDKNVIIDTKRAKLFSNSKSEFHCQNEKNITPKEIGSSDKEKFRDDYTESNFKVFQYLTNIKNTGERILNDISINTTTEMKGKNKSSDNDKVDIKDVMPNELDMEFMEDYNEFLCSDDILNVWIKDVKDNIKIDQNERFYISDIYRHTELRKIDLLLTAEKKKIKRICSLEGGWINTFCKKGDIVCVQAEFIEGCAKVNNDYGLLIVHPDHLISSTTISSALFCMRKTILAEKFQGWNPGNASMLLGTIIHQLFQEIIQDDHISFDSLNRRLNSILKEAGNLHSLYANNTNENEIANEAIDYFPHIIKWKEENMNKNSYLPNKENENIQISSIIDIEDTHWCPRYGIRGKIDLTAEVKIHEKKKLIPIELKTGRSSFSFEHQAQVILYTMMMEHRNNDCESGLLLYLKDGPQMRTIFSPHNIRRDLIQLRNELVYYLINSSSPHKISSELNHPSDGLPQPMNKKRFCQKCSYLLPCTLNQRIFGDKLDPDHIINDLIPDNVNHLSSSHLNYFKQWYILLHLEKQSLKNIFYKQFWKQSLIEREQQGLCFGEMILSHPTQYPDKWWTGKSYVHSFKKFSSTGNLENVGLHVSDYIIISNNDNTELAIAAGEIININNTCIDVLLDKDLYQKSTWTKEMYRLDKITSNSSTTIQFTNLLHLMDNANKSANLRKLLIDCHSPSFEEIVPLKKENFPEIKSLNSQQIKSIEKVLSSNDYILIKGMPGTGKTFTLVALVGLLTRMGNSVLLTSHTHCALDNVLIKLKQQNINFIRLGRLSRIHPFIHSHAAEILTETVKTVEELKLFYRSKQVVGVTCLGINHPIFQHRYFDICIVDEASQILQTVCLGPLFYAKKFVLIGDSQQLPPVVQSKEAKSQGMSESLFSRLETIENTVDLNLQYRMNREIMTLCNLLTYKGKLKCGSSVLENATLTVPKLDSLSDNINWHKSLLSNELKKAVIFLNTDNIPAPETYDLQGLVQNEIEVNIVTQIVWTLIKGGILADDIGVISPYKKQVTLIQNSLLKHHLLDIEVNTVDQYQGRDKSVIIISFVRSATGNKVAELLEDERRLNVAISRAKLKLIFIGSISTLVNYVPFKRLIMHLSDNQLQDACKSSISTFWENIDIS